MMRQLIALWSFVLASTLLVHAQSSGIQWERTFGGAEADFAVVVKPTTDGGFVLGGYSYSESSAIKAGAHYESGDYWIVKLDAAGNQQWDKSYGGTQFDGIRNLQQATDGGFIVAGTSFSGASGNKTSPGFGSNSADYWVLKLNASGNKQWENSFGGTEIDTVADVKQTTDGGYIVGGTSSSAASGNKTSGNFGSGSEDYWIVKIDPGGNKQWDRTFGGNQDDQMTSLQPTSDGGCILAGTSYSGISGNKTAVNRGNGRGDYWVVKLDAAGNKQWEQSFGGDDAEQLHTVQKTSDGGYLLGGSSTSRAGGNKSSGNFGSHDYWVVKIDGSGNKQWDKTYGGDESDELHAIQATTDGGYVLGGVSFSQLTGNKASVSFGSETGDYWMVKIDGQGNKQSEQSIRGSFSGEVLRLEQSADGGLMLPGLAGAGTGDLDFALAKFGAPLRLASSSLRSGQVFQTQLIGMSGTSYILQASTNLTAWSSVLTNRAVNGVVSFTHTNAAGISRRFYRVQKQP